MENVSINVSNLSVTGPTKHRNTFRCLQRVARADFYCSPLSLDVNHRNISLLPSQAGVETKGILLEGTSSKGRYLAECKKGAFGNDPESTMAILLWQFFFSQTLL